MSVSSSGVDNVPEGGGLCELQKLDMLTLKFTFESKEKVNWRTCAKWKQLQRQWSHNI